MLIFETVLGLLLLATALSTFAKRAQIPYPTILALGGALTAFVPGAPRLDLPPDLSADVRATTVNGEISTDFPMTIAGRVSHRHVAGTIGSGGRQLDLQTVNGSVRLRRR